MTTQLMAWPDERAGMQAFLKGEIGELPAGHPIGAQGTTLRAQQDSLIMFMAVFAREAVGLGLTEQEADTLCGRFLAAIESADADTLPSVVHQVQWTFRHQVIGARTNRYSLHVSQALTFIDQHLFARLTVRMLAEYAGVSERHLGQLFKQEVGTTLTAYITDAKMTAAKRLLRSGRYTVAEIADMLGYASPSYFCNLFRKTTEISPKQYATSLQSSLG